MDAAQKLQSYFDIIDKNVASEKGRNEAPFSFLGEDMMTRFITTTPNKRACVEALKTYLAKDILKINCGKDYVTYKNILENLEGTAKKKYQVDTWRLEACFDWEKNCDAIEKELNTSMVQLEQNYREKVVGRGLFARGEYERKCSACGRKLDKEYVMAMCKNPGKYQNCNKYRGPINSY